GTLGRHATRGITMNIAVQRLNARERPALIAHFLALPAEDRRLRFGCSLSSEAIVVYVDQIEFARDAVFVSRDDWLALIGVAHLAFGDDVAELGLSVLPGDRRHGVGSALFER